jgi:hypothetical protein
VFKTALGYSSEDILGLSETIHSTFTFKLFDLTLISHDNTFEILQPWSMEVTAYSIGKYEVLI